jgi:hypothetical protein
MSGGCYGAGRHCQTDPLFVMAGLVPAIHALGFECAKDVDARHKAGHDDFSLMF